jgi:hypothetical protein
MYNRFMSIKRCIGRSTTEPFLKRFARTVSPPTVRHDGGWLRLAVSGTLRRGMPETIFTKVDRETTDDM